MYMYQYTYWYTLKAGRVTIVIVSHVLQCSSSYSYTVYSTYVFLAPATVQARDTVVRLD